MRRHDRLRAVVAGERRQRREAGGAEAHRMSALSLVERRRDDGSFFDRCRDAGDRGRCDPRHVAQRDDPAGRVGSRAHTAREARPHAGIRIRAAHDARSRRTERRRERCVAGPHDGHHARHDREQIPARHHADEFAGRRSARRRRVGACGRAGPDQRQQLVAAEALAAPRGEQNAHDAGNGARHHCPIGRAGVIRHAPRRRGRTTTPTGNCSRRASR